MNQASQLTFFMASELHSYIVALLGQLFVCWTWLEKNLTEFDSWRCFSSVQVCQWQPFQARWCLRRASPCRWRLPLSTLCCWCPTWIQRSGVGAHVTRILTNHGPPSRLTVVINILVPPQSVSPHCLFILFGEKRLNISEAADSNRHTCHDPCQLPYRPYRLLCRQRAARWQQQWELHATNNVAWSSAGSWDFV